MCYSAEFKAEYRTYLQYGGKLDVEEFARLFGDRFNFPIKIPRQMEAWFDQVDDPGAVAVRELVARYRKQSSTKLEQALFKQKKRLADAERAMRVKRTKKAETDLRVAPGKIEKALLDLEDLKRTDLRTRDSDFYPGNYAPVIIIENGERVIKPMRYRCRLPGWDANVEKALPGTYNARRDKLDTSWRRLFGKRHGVIVINSFREHVERHKREHRELREGEKSEDVVLQFWPRQAQDMVIACLWNDSPDGDRRLLSFAAITDDPAPEVAAAGHDRTIIQIKPEHIDAWLTPEGRSVDELQALLDDRPEAYYEHALAA